MAETFGETSILPTASSSGDDVVRTCKYSSGSAGSLASITIHTGYNGAVGKMKCAIYDDSADPVLLANGTTEEKDITVPTLGWLTFNFGATKPVVLAATAYRLAFWSNVTHLLRRDTGAANQEKAKPLTYASWPSPLAGWGGAAYKWSIYATYVEAPTYVSNVIMIQCSSMKNNIYRRFKNLWVPELKKLWLPIPPVSVPKRIMV